MEIRLFVSCHRETVVPACHLLAPIQVGTALEKSRFEGFLYDDIGENISHLNRSYCELTAQYWAWKNANIDYYGFFHYRRYLYPDTEAKVPYRIERSTDVSVLKKLHYNEFESFICQYDLIVPISENMHVSVREHYAGAPFHHGSDLTLVEQIVSEKYSEYVPAMEEYLSGTNCYFGNIFIMRRQLFVGYCEWLFSILAEFDKRADTGNYSQQERRVDGYLAERLLGVYVTHQRQTAEMRIAEIPKVHFISDPKEYYKDRICNTLLPPGTKRRSVIKRILRRDVQIGESIGHHTCI